MNYGRRWMTWVVILISVGLLMTQNGVFAEDEIGQAIAQMTELDAAVQAFNGTTKTYPTLLDHLIQGPEDFEGEWMPLIVKEALNDPWGIPYVIILFDEAEAAETHLNYQLSSAGPDREFGTEDDIYFPVNKSVEDEAVVEDGGADEELFSEEEEE